MKIKKQFGFIIFKHTSLLLLCIFLFFAIAFSRQQLDDVYNDASSLGHTVADALDGDRMTEYASTLEKDEMYESEKKWLQQLKTNFKDCRYLYIFVPDGNGKAIYIYDIYTEKEYATKEVDEGDLGYIEDFTEEVVGTAVKLYETGGEIKKLDIDLFNKYGSLASYYTPVYNSTGTITAIVGVDYSIVSIVYFIGFVLGIMLLLFAASGVVFGIYEISTVDKKIISVIEEIKRRVGEYVNSEHDGHSEKYRIDIKENSENELDILGHEMNRMMQEMDEYIINNEKETREKERISSELDLASRIQSGYLPRIFPPFPDRTDFVLYASMNPAKEVAGDFYDFFMIDDNHLGLVIADVSGKGVGAALYMMVSKTMLKDQTLFLDSPAQILEAVNDRLCVNNEADMFVTAWVGILDLESGVLKASNAGHEYPILKKNNGDFELIKDKHGLVLGGMDGAPYTEYELQLEPGDKLYLYTDGVTEATNADKELFGTDRLIDSLNKAKNDSIEDILGKVHKDIDEFVDGEPQFDDITMLGIQYLGK